MFIVLQVWASWVGAIRLDSSRRKSAMVPIALVAPFGLLLSGSPARAQSSCPTNYLCDVSFTSPTGSCAGDFGNASYDAIRGTLSVAIGGGSELSVTMTDRYVISNFPLGTPVALRARLLVSNEGDNFCCPDGWCSCDQPRAAVEAGINGVGTCLEEPSTSLEILVPAQAGVPFEISCTLRGFYYACTAGGFAFGVGSGQLSFLDLPAGAQITSCQGFQQGIVAVGPGSPQFELAIEKLHPNPARGAFMAAFTLPTDSPASLGLYDVAGRLVMRAEVRGAGRKSVAIGRDATLRAGIYQVRLTQDGRVARSRVIVVN